MPFDLELLLLIGVPTAVLLLPLLPERPLLLLLPVVLYFTPGSREILTTVVHEAGYLIKSAAASARRGRGDAGRGGVGSAPPPRPVEYTQQQQQHKSRKGWSRMPSWGRRDDPVDFGDMRGRAASNFTADPLRGWGGGAGPYHPTAGPGSSSKWSSSLETDPMHPAAVADAVVVDVPVTAVTKLEELEEEHLGGDGNAPSAGSPSQSTTASPSGGIPSTDANGGARSYAAGFSGTGGDDATPVTGAAQPQQPSEWGRPAQQQAAVGSTLTPVQLRQQEEQRYAARWGRQQQQRQPASRLVRTASSDRVGLDMPPEGSLAAQPGFVRLLVRLLPFLRSWGGFL